MIGQDPGPRPTPQDAVRQSVEDGSKRVKMLAAQTDGILWLMSVCGAVNWGNRSLKQLAD